jgi:hypothetical protein
MKKMKELLLFFVFSSCIIAFGAKNEKIIKLGKPILIQGKKSPIKVKQQEFAYPVVYDWNHDGKKDLIIGENSTRAKFRVYLNKGTDAKPKFSGKFLSIKDMQREPLFAEAC